MSPELERLLQALYEKRTCPPSKKPSGLQPSSVYCKTPLRGGKEQAEMNSWMLCTIDTRVSSGPPETAFDATTSLIKTVLRYLGVDLILVCRLLAAYVPELTTQHNLLNKSADAIVLGF